MITLHRIGHTAEPFELNADLIVTIEATPDTVITLTTGTKIVVAEPPDRVVEAIRAWRAALLADALQRRKQELGTSGGTTARRAAAGILSALPGEAERPVAPGQPG